MSTTQAARRSNDPLVFTIPETAKRLKVSLRLVEREIAEGKIKVARLGKRRMLVPAFEIERYIRATMIERR